MYKKTFRQIMGFRDFCPCIFFYKTHIKTKVGGYCNGVPSVQHRLPDTEALRPVRQLHLSRSVHVLGKIHSVYNPRIFLNSLVSNWEICYLLVGHWWKRTYASSCM